MNLDIVKIASDTKNHGKIKDCTHSSKLKNPICGDEMSIYLLVKNELITDMKYQCKSCIFCQASVSMLSNKSINKKITEIKKLLINVEFFFNNNIKSIDKEWLDLEIILNKKNIARKECLLLPFKAMQKALKIK